MNNRWSDAARLAALAVRQGRAFAAAPGKANVAPQAGGLAAKPVTFPTKPNIFYSAHYPYGPGQEGRVMGDGKTPMPPKAMPPRITPPMPPRITPPKKIQRRVETPVKTGLRVIIAGKRYTRVGNKLVPDAVAPKAKKLLAGRPVRVANKPSAGTAAKTHPVSFLR